MGIKTLLQEYLQYDLVLNLDSELKVGELAAVFKVVSDKNQPYALKVYYGNMQTSFDKYIDYIDGSEIGEVYRKITANNPKNKLVEKVRLFNEYNMLKNVYEAGAHVPKPFCFTDNSILMEFIGSEKSAPSLNEIELTQSEALDAFRQIIRSIGIFLDYGWIHCNLTPENILWKNGRCYIIDFCQSSSTTKTKDPYTKLYKDLQTIAKYFKKYMVFDVDAQLAIWSYHFE